MANEDDKIETKEQSNDPEAPKKSPAKKAAGKKAAAKKAAAKSAAKKQRARAASKAIRNYPPITLEKCLIIAQKIKELNGGNAWTPKDISKAVGIGFGTNNFYYYTASSRDFGFTVGSSKTSQIELTDLGRDLVYAPNPEVERRKKIEAFLKIDIFKKVLDYYKGSSLPEMKYLSNTLENQFKLHPDLHEEFSQIFNENCKDLKITTGNPLEEDANGSGTNSPVTVIVGEAKKNAKGKFKAFVIMPFVERNEKRPAGFFKEVLDSLLIPAGIEAGFTVETANKQGSDVIQSTIINELLEADLVITDLTDHNPNVLFELGMRMAIDKPVALIKSNDTGKIFDVDNMLRVHEYNQNLWKSTIEKDVPDLIEHFKAAWENRSSEQTYMKILRRGNLTSQ
jgi:hypothetical protein